MSEEKKKVTTQACLPDEIRIPMVRALEKILPKVTKAPKWIRGVMGTEDDEMVSFMNDFRLMSVANYSDDFLQNKMDKESFLHLLDQARLDNFVCIKILNLLNKIKAKHNLI